MESFKYINILIIMIFIVTSNLFTQTGEIFKEETNNLDTIKADSLIVNHVRVIKRHDGIINTLAYSPDGKYLASGGKDGIICISDPGTGELILTIDNKKEVTSLVFSHDSLHLAYGDGEKIVILDTKKFEKINKLAGFIDPVRSLAFKPGKELVLFGCSDYLIPKWYIGDNKFKQKEVYKAVNTLIFSHNGEYFAHGGEDRKITIRNSKSGKIEEVLEGHKDDVTSIVYAPADEYLVSGSDDESIRIWNLKNGNLLKQMDQGEDVTAIDISSDGKLMISGDRDGCLKIWDMTAAVEVKSLEIEDEIVALAFDKDGDFFSLANSAGEIIIIKSSFLLGFPGRNITLEDFIKGKDAVLNDSVDKFKYVDFLAVSRDNSSVADLDEKAEEEDDGGAGQLFSQLVEAVSNDSEEHILYTDSAMTVDLQKYKTYQRIDFSNTVKRNSASVFPRIGDNYYTKLKRDSVYFTLSGISSRYKDGAEIDSSMQYVVIYEKLFEEDYKQTVIMKLADYKEQRLKYENKNLWYQQVATVSDKESSTSSNGEIQINIPVKIKSRTFNRIFGGNRIGLRVRGDLSFSLIGSKSATSGYSLSGDESGSFDFKMDQTQNISIRGKVGSKVDVDINQNTESMDFENTLKITYTGDSDEIVQKLEAGNIGLSLPGTKYVTFSGKNTGLFGIKTDLKIGNLTSTIIASLEKGKKKKLELTGGVRTQTKIIEADKYQKLKYFFLDDSYRENYSSPNNYEKRLSHTVMDVSQTPVKSNSFNLYITSRANGSDREKANIYVDCQNRDQLEIDGIQNLYKENNWVRWIDPDDYVINDGLGYIYLKSVNLQAGEVLAARYNKYDVETGNEIEIGERDENGLLHLQIIAENGQNYDDPWSDNEWKNVYYLGGSDVRKDGFKLTIFKGDDSETKTPKKKTYLEWYQVAQENEQDVDLGFLNSANGEFFFPELTPFWPDLNLNSNLDSIHLYDQDSAIVAQFVDSLIYKEDDKRSEFKLQVEFASKSSTFDLGFNVIEDSEVVRMGATQLVRDIDYIIDYNTGQLSIINGDAMTGDLEILYESASIFQLDQKLLLGNRWQYQFTKDAWLGATILYLSESTKEDRIHVGYEPKKNFVWDVNGKASFEVPFFTRIVDNIPFINTDAKSKISLEGEIAQIIPNPNPLGKAFVDDFEGSRRQRSLGMIYYGWHPASLPDDYETEGSYSYKPEVISDNIDPKILPYFLKSHACEGRLNFFWYNPQSDEQREKREIYREGMEGDEGTQKINTLNFEFDPAGESPALAEQVNIGDRWNGVMRYIPTMYQDFSEIKYIEFLVGTDQKITLNFDIGELSEDAIPNGFIDTEDINGDGKLNDLDGEDIGLDGMGKRDNNDFYTIAADPDSAREARFYEFRSYDDHPMNGDRPKPDSDIQYEEYNKTQGNGRLDTEDLDLGGNLDLTVKGYRYSLELNNNISDLNEGDGYLVSKDTYEGQFALYRIPLDDIRRKIIGSDEPDMEKIKYVKLWFNGASSKTKVEFVSLDFVGNEWKAEGDNKGKIDAATINSIDNNNYTPPFKVEEDSDGNEVKEQSICLKLNLDQDYGVNDKEAFVVKELYKGENYIEYQKIKMYVHGGDGLIPWPEERDIYFVYRFGKDSVNYYEYRSKLKNGWAGNELDVQLDSLTYLKTKRAEKGITNVDSLFMVPYNNMEMSRLIGIYGNPSLRDIRYLAAGVVDYGTEALETELWLDELRLTGIRKEKGMAMRGQINFQFADFATLDAEIERKDAEFHNVHQRMGSGTNELNFNLNSKLELGMFFPKSYGISLPLRYTHINNYSYSKYEGSTDILVAENDIPDSVKIETKSHRARISVKKNSKSKNPFVKHTLDKLSFGADAFFSEEKNSTYIKKETETYSYNASYNLSFPKEWVTFSPFKWTENIWGLKKIKNEKISLIPSSYSTSIATSQSLTESRSRKDAFRTNNIFTVTRTLSTSFNPISILKTNYSLNLNSDMYKKKISIVDDETGNSTRGVAVDYHKYDYKSFLEGKFGELSSWSSNFDNSLNFKLTKWFNQSITHNTSYSWNSTLVEKGTRKVANKMNTSVNITVKTREVLTSFGKGYDFLAELFKDDDKDKIEDKEGEVKKKGSNLKDRFKGGNDKTRDGFLSKGNSRNKGSISLFSFFKKNLKDFKFGLGRSRTNSTSNIENSFDQADWRYMFALENEPQNYGDEKNLTYSWNGAWEISGRTALTVSKNLSLGNISYNYKRSYSNSSLDLFGGEDFMTQFLWPWGDGHQDTWAFDDYSFNLPDYNVTISGIEKMMKSKFITSISLNHAKSGSKSVGWGYPIGDVPAMNYMGIPDMDLGDSKLEINRKSYSMSFSPLLGIKINFKRGINLNASYNYSFTLNENYNNNDKKIGSGTKKYSKGFTVSGGYVQSGGFKTPFNFWPFDGKRIKNTIRYNLSINYNFTEDYKAEKEGDANSIMIYPRRGKGTEINSFTFSPTITYEFSKKLNGSFTYSYNYNKSSDNGATPHESTNHEIALKALWKITGR